MPTFSSLKQKIFIISHTSRDRDPGMPSLDRYVSGDAVYEDLIPQSDGASISSLCIQCEQEASSPLHVNLPRGFYNVCSSKVNDEHERERDRTRKKKKKAKGRL